MYLFIRFVFHCSDYCYIIARQTLGVYNVLCVWVIFKNSEQIIPRKSTPYTTRAIHPLKALRYFGVYRLY